MWSKLIRISENQRLTLTDVSFLWMQSIMHHIMSLIFRKWDVTFWCAVHLSFLDHIQVSKRYGINVEKDIYSITLFLDANLKLSPFLYIRIVIWQIRPTSWTSSIQVKGMHGRVARKDYSNVPVGNRNYKFWRHCWNHSRYTIHSFIRNPFWWR